MSYLDTITREREPYARRTLIYGGPGDGKTTWASRWPDPFLLPTEDGFRHIDVPHGALLTTAKSAYEATRQIIEGHPCKTIIVDSIDWFENFCQRDLDDSSIDQGWGRGNRELAARLSSYLQCLSAARDAGKHVVLIGHSMLEEISRPDGLTYQSHNVKLTPKAREVVIEWCDEVLFCTRDTLVRQKPGEKYGIGVDKNTRSLYTKKTPQYTAKNRIVDLPEKFDLSDVDSYLSHI